MCGEEALLSASLAEVILLLRTEMQHNIAEAGGLAGWEAFPPGERELHEIAAYQRICVKLGEDRPATLTLKEWHYVSLFIWGGCCMHKEMNSVKGGNAWMMAWWSENNLEGLMKLYNWDNSSAATLGGDAARE